MNPAGIGATLAAHKVPLLLGGAGIAVFLGLRHKASATATTATATGAPIAGYAASSGGTTYDSSASDVYNALQPQIEQTQGMLSKLQDLITGNASSTTKTPTPAPAPVPSHPVNTPAPRPAPTPLPRTMPTPSPVRKPTVTPPRTYNVRPGDNLTTIGAKFGLGWAALYNANKAAVGRNPNLIHPGLQLIIPGR